MIIKPVLLVAIGAAGALELDRWWSRQRERLRPSALTTTLIDRANAKLEAQREAPEPAAH